MMKQLIQISRKNRISTTALFTTALFLSALGVNDTKAAIISLRSTATINGSVIRLGDLAHITDADPAVVKQLSNLLIAPAVGSGREDIIDLSRIRERMLARGINLSKIEFEGRSQVRVSNPDINGSGSNSRFRNARHVERSADRVQRTLIQAIERHLKILNPELSHVTVSVDLKPNDLARLYTGLGRGYLISGGAAPWDGPQKFMVEYFTSQTVRNQLVVHGEIEQRPMILVAKHTIPSGSVLRNEDLVWQRSDHQGQVISELKDAVYYETKKSIRKGQPIIATDIRPVPLVRTNALITVSVQVAGITIQRQMKARSNGATGEMISVVSLDGRDRLMAQVTGRNEAAIVTTPDASRQEPTSQTVIFQNPANKRINTRPNKSNRFRPNQRFGSNNR